MLACEEYTHILNKPINTPLAVSLMQEVLARRNFACEMYILLKQNN